MKKLILCFTFFLVICFNLPPPVTAQIVSIPDANLRAAVETALGKASGAPITADEMATLPRLDAREAGISDLTGLEGATNLTRLDLGENAIRDISVLAGLTNLIELFLDFNNIRNISVLAGLSNLIGLDLGYNAITDHSILSGLTNLTRLDLRRTNTSDLSVLSGLTNLTGLYIDSNGILDLAPLAVLTNLMALGLNGNSISDLSPLRGLTNLSWMRLVGNNITDLSPLVANTGLGSGDEVLLNDNPLSSVSIKTHVPALQSRGVTVEFDNLIPFVSIPFDINNIPEPVPPPGAVRDFFELDPFYQQWIDVEGLPIVASEKVNPYALKETAWLIWQVIGHRPEVLEALVKNRVRFSVIAYTELITEIPEYRNYGGGFLSDRFRGFGGSGELGRPAVSSSEEQLLHYPGSNSLYSVMIHEFAHAIHHFGLPTIGPTFDNRLKSAYDAAIAKGLWQGTYASSDRREYWAEGTHAWFYPKGRDSFNNGNTRDALKAYDPPLAALLAEVYGDTGWRYTPLAVRLDLPHLQGFNPQDSPTFEGWPELYELERQFFDPSSEDGKHWVDLRPYDPNLLPSLNQSRTAGSLSEGIAFVNLTQSRVFVYSVGYNGTEEYWTIVNPGDLRVNGGRINDIWLIKDHNGNDFVMFQSKAKLGRAIIGGVPIVTPGLSKNAGDNQSGVPGAVLPSPLVVEVRDENGLALEGISVTFAVTAGDRTLSVTRTTTDESGQAESTLTLGPNLGMNTVSMSAVGFEGAVTFDAIVEAAIDIPDVNLRAAVDAALGIAPGAPITPSKMATLPRLEAPEAGISNLIGLEGATNLIDLHLWRNSVLDLSPLAGLTNLTGLYLGGSSVSDLLPLVGLTNLESLYLDENGISDLSPLAGLTKLRRLALNGNSISDLSPLTELTSLKWIRLKWNSISDLSPLVSNTGLGEGDEVNVKGNPLSYLSIHTHIPYLQSRGVTVEFDNQAHPALLKISGDNQNGASLVRLSQPFVVEAQDANGSVLAGVSVRFAVTAGGGTLTTTITSTDTNGRAQSTLTLGPNLGTNTVSVSASGIQVRATFHAVSDTEAPPTIADINNDGSVNVLDLILITSNLDTKGSNLAADVNRDGVVNILDLVLVAGMLDTAAAAPSTQPQVPEILTAVEVHGWLTDARALEIRDPIMKRGIIMLEQLLISLTPTDTELLANYPNPFNPETWIPYRLAEDAFVRLTIYGSSGHVVRTLEVGHQIASAYENRSKAIYWDGRNDVGERVASGVYFYTLSAGEYSATRRMLIIK